MPGFCKSATTDEIKVHGYILTLGRYVGAEAVEDDGEPFEEKMVRLTTQLKDQFAKSTRPWYMQKSERATGKSISREILQEELDNEPVEEGEIIEEGEQRWTLLKS
jgi:hypothetical protein